MRKKFKNYSDFIEYFRSFEIDKLKKKRRYLFRIWHYERLVVEL